MTKKQAIKLAKIYASRFDIQHAGVTKDGMLVTTLDCVNYQKRNGTLLYHMDGRWVFGHFYDNKGESYIGWKSEGLVTISYVYSKYGRKVALK